MLDVTEFRRNCLQCMLSSVESNYFCWAENYLFENILFVNALQVKEMREGLTLLACAACRNFSHIIRVILAKGA